MASGGSKSAATMLLFLNLGLYIIVTIVAGWAVNHAIERTHETGNVSCLIASDQHDTLGMITFR